MKKLLSLIGAFILLGLSAANAITVNFSFYTTNNENPGNYVDLLDNNDGFKNLVIPENGQMMFDYEDNLSLTLMPKTGKSCEIAIVGSNGMTVDTFNGFDVGHIGEDEGIWDIYVSNSEMLNNFTFYVEITPEESGNTGGDSGNEGGNTGGDVTGESLNATLMFSSSDEEFAEEFDGKLYSFVKASARALEGGEISDIDWESDYCPFTYTPSVSFTFEPVADEFMIEDIVLAKGNDYITDSPYAQITPPTTVTGEWTLTLKEGLPDGLYIYVMVSPADESSDTPPVTGGEEKTVILNVVAGDYSILTGMVWFSENHANLEYIEFNQNPLSFEYSDYIGMNLYSGDNNYKTIEVVCADSNLEKGKDYELEEDDGAWFITLTASAPKEITFNITAPEIVKTATLKIAEGLNPDDVPGTYFYSDEFEGFEEIKYNDGQASFTYTNYLGISVVPEVDIEINCTTQGVPEDAYKIEKEDYEGQIVWFIYLDKETPDNIYFTISVQDVQAPQKTVTLNFNEIVEGLTVEYSDDDASAEYTPTSTPFVFPVSSETTSNFSISAEGYDIEISLAEEDAKYDEVLAFIDGTEVMLNAPNVNLTFNVEVTKKEEVKPVTLKFEGADYKDGMVTVTQGTTPLKITNGVLLVTNTSDNISLTLTVSDGYVLTFDSEIEEGVDTYLTKHEGGSLDYYLTLYSEMDGKTITVTVTEDKSTGINSVVIDENTEVYNLQGVRVKDNSKLMKGLYIINGKKVMVK